MTIVLVMFGLLAVPVAGVLLIISAVVVALRVSGHQVMSAVLVVAVFVPFEKGDPAHKCDATNE